MEIKEGGLKWDLNYTCKIQPIQRAAPFPALPVQVRKSPNGSPLKYVDEVEPLGVGGTLSLGSNAD